jgi:flagellar biosynthetic protein FliR
VNLLVNADSLLLFLPAFARISGLLAAAPIFKQVQLPTTLKVAIALSMTVALWPLLSAGTPPAISGLWGLTYLVGTELVLGLFMGMVATILFVGVEYAGQMIGQAIGLAMAEMLDPVFDAQVSILSRVYGLFALAVFFASNAHHILIRVVFDSFGVVPVGAVTLASIAPTQLVDLGSEIFLTGIRIAAPILGVMLVTEIGMGFVVRTVPQMNIFIVGFPLKIGMGFFLVGFTMPLVVRVLEGLFLRMDRELRIILTGM